MISSMPLDADSTSYVLPLDRAQCVFDNRSAYLAGNSDIVIIVVDQCPNTSLFAGASEGLQNYSGVSRIQTGVDGEFDPVISYTRDDLRCLDIDDVRVEGDVAYLPRVVSCAD